MQSAAANMATVRGFPLFFALLFSALGCGRGHAETSRAPDPAATAPSPPIVIADKMKAAQDNAGSNDSEDDEWIPITGSEQVIVGDIASLTDGAAVRAEPAAEANSSATSDEHVRRKSRRTKE